ncbi:24K membrane protein [Pseudomonas aeruginosa]|nr:24K membrane protein [Pseudomonas aeruginosa]
MGYTLGPILNMYLGLPNGGSVITSAFAMTALVFFGLSAYVLTTRKDMSFLSGFITAGFFVLLGAVLVSLFFQISGLQLAISAGFVLFSSGDDPLPDQRDHPTAANATTSWPPSACTCRSTTCSSACCRSSASPAATTDRKRLRKKPVPATGFFICGPAKHRHWFIIRRNPSRIAA